MNKIFRNISKLFCRKKVTKKHKSLKQSNNDVNPHNTIYKDDYEAYFYKK